MTACPAASPQIAAAASASFSADVTDIPCARAAGKTAAEHIAGTARVDRLDVRAGKRGDLPVSGPSTRQPSAPSVTTTVPAPLAASAPRPPPCHRPAGQRLRLASIHDQHSPPERSPGGAALADRAGVQHGSRARSPVLAAGRLRRRALQVALHDDDVAGRDPAASAVCAIGSKASQHATPLTMKFSPPASTKIVDRSLGRSNSVSLERRTRSSSRRLLIHAPRRRCRAPSTGVTGAPVRAAATAWFAPLPPRPRQ